MSKGLRVFLIFSGLTILLISFFPLFLGSGKDKVFGFVFMFLGFFFLWRGIKKPIPKKTDLMLKKKFKEKRQIPLELLDVNRVVMQTLESIDVISTTKNIDTLKSRLSLFSKLFKELKESYTSENYRITTIQTIDDYKQLYYNKDLTDYQAVAVTNPLEFNFNNFASLSIMHCFIRNYEFQKLAINELKTERGRQGRYKKLFFNLKQTLDLLLNEYKCSTTDDYINKLSPFKLEIEKSLAKPNL